MKILKIRSRKFLRLFSRNKKEEKYEKLKPCYCGKYAPVSRKGRFADSSCRNCGGSRPYRSQSYCESKTFDNGWGMGMG